MDKSRFQETKPWCVVSTLPKVGVLVDSTRDETWYLVDQLEVRSEDERKGRRE